jgi:hypothetical protein
MKLAEEIVKQINEVKESPSNTLKKHGWVPKEYHTYNGWKTEKDSFVHPNHEGHTMVISRTEERIPGSFSLVNKNGAPQTRHKTKQVVNGNLEHWNNKKYQTVIPHSELPEYMKTLKKE